MTMEICGLAGDINNILGRVSSIDAASGGSTPLAEYEYMGAGTIIKVEHPQVSGGLNLTYGESATPPASSYAGFDNLGRVINQLWENDAQTVTHDQFKYGYDGASNRTWKENAITHAAPALPQLDEFYTYDDLNRLINTDRGTLTGTHPDYSAPTAPTFEQDWTLSPTGNWSTFNDDGASQTRTHNLANEVQTISGTWVNPAHDATGNMKSAPWPSGPNQPANAETTRQHYTFDAWNRMRSVYKDNVGTPGTPGDLVATYDYDGINRRIKKTLYDPPAEKPKEKESLTSISISPTSQTVDYTLDYYYNTGRQVIEIQKDDNATYPYEQYIWGLRYIHSPILRYEDHSTNDTVEELYYTQDANFNTTALVDPDDGSVVERYSYDPYGKVKILDPTTWAEITWSASKQNIILYTGHKFDPESGLYNGDARYLHSTVGRWTAQDPLNSNKPSGGYHDGMSLYQYVRSGPVTYLDPLGLRTKDWVWCGTKSLYIETDYCCADDVKKIHKAACSAFNTMSETSDALWNYINKRPWTAAHDKTRLHFNRFFYRRQAGDLEHNHVNNMQERYHDLIDEMDDSDGTHYQCDRKKGSCATASAYVKGAFGWTVHICHNFFHVRDDKERSKVIMHELSHMYQHTSDHNYTYVTELDRDGLPIYIKVDIKTNKGSDTSLSQSKRFTHADTLAAFALMWYVP